MGKTQQIIEAEAELQAARALNAIEDLNTSLIDFYALYDKDLQGAITDLNMLIEFFKFFSEKNKKRWTNHDEKTLKVLKTVLRITAGLSGFKLNKICQPKLTLVTKIISGIKLRSKYEQEIEELKARLNRARSLYKILNESNEKIRSSAAKLLDDKKHAKEFVLTAKQYQFKDVIDRMMSNYIPKVQCDSDIELPF